MAFLLVQDKEIEPTTQNDLDDEEYENCKRLGSSVSLAFICFGDKTTS